MASRSSPLRATLALLIGAVVLNGCTEAVTGPVLAPPTSFQQAQEPPNCVVVNGNPDSDIFNPCVLGGIVVTARRQPGGPIEWPGGAPCTSIPGGCFPEDGEPIVGNETYYNMGGGSSQPRGTEVGWHNPQALYTSPMHRATVQLAISRIFHAIRDPMCEDLVSELASRVSWGIYLATENYSRLGEWVGEEPDGTIYLNSKPGELWDSFGNVIDEGSPSEPLLNTLIEEMIHMWFDTDIGHSPTDTDEQQAAFDLMRGACGKHGFSYPY